MARHQIVRRELRFDVGFGNDATDANVHSLENLRYVKIDIHHRHVEAVVIVVLEQLVAEKPARDHEAIVETVNARDPKAPIDVVSLELIRDPLNVENELVLLEPVWAQIVNQREIRIRSARCVCRCADVPRKIFPAVNLNSASLPRVAIRSGVDRFHHGRWPNVSRIADDRRPADLPIRGRKRRRIKRRHGNSSCR